MSGPLGGIFLTHTVFLPNIIKIDLYIGNFKLYRFKVGSFLRHV